jgi:hypothetical protein
VGVDGLLTCGHRRRRRGDENNPVEACIPDLVEIALDIRFARLDFDGDLLTGPLRQQVDRAIAFDRVLTHNVVALLLEEGGGLPDPEGVLQALARRWPGIDAEEQTVRPNSVNWYRTT